ncbi:MAG: hypothetical protein WC197_09840 [Candidatus Gastranaerophilaceae bacterium]|jgi:hypothetical protein
MQLKNIVIQLENKKELTVDYIENAIKKYGEPLRWAIVKENQGQLFVNSVIILN